MNTKEAASYIPDFFYDLISRIIPGFLILTVYNFEKLHEDLKLQIIVLCFFAAYLIGFILNQLAGFLWQLLFFRYKGITNLVFVKTKYYSLYEIWQIVKANQDPQVKNVAIKNLAEHLMFKTLTLIPLICIFYRPQIFRSLNNLTSAFILLIASGIFSFCMLTIHRSLCRGIEAAKND